MTLIAGVMMRHASDRVDPAMRAALRRAVSRHPGESPVVHDSEQVSLVKVDVGAFGAEAFRVAPSGSVALLAGDPLLERGDEVASRGRTEDLTRLHDRLDRNEPGLLREARGTYCLAHYHPGRHELLLVADKLGLRPIYVWTSPRLVVFASALRVLESLDSIPKRMDLQAVTEEIAHGFPLGTRTPYEDVRALYAGQTLRFAGDREVESRYWRWDELPPVPDQEEELLDLAHERFQRAVAARLGAQRSARSFLSGGLDSRCVVSALQSQGAVVHTHTFGFPGTQDQIYSDRFARASGTVHHPVLLDDPTIPSLAGMLREALAQSAGTEAPPVEWPNQIWSGDGGSVGVGCSYMKDDVVALMRQNRREDAIQRYLAHRAAVVRRGVLRPEIARSLETVLAKGVGEELDGIHCADPARSFHLFLMLNDQRRHLAGHFEGIDLHRIEYVLPFFDAPFLEVMCGGPLDYFLRHRFYNRWLSRFPEVVRSLPWQAYPGHEPCPVADDRPVIRQWDAAYDRIQARRERPRFVAKAWELLRSPDFPGPILNRTPLQIAALLHQLGIRDCRYLLAAAEVYGRYWLRSGGRYRLPDGTRHGLTAS